MQSLPTALNALRAYPQFIIQQATRMPDGSIKKEPISPNTMRRHDAYDPSIWMDADTAITMANSIGGGMGVGFVLTAEDPFFFLDLDKVREGDGWTQFATDTLARFTGAAVEVSVSGKGLHVVGTGAHVIPENSRKRNDPVGLELYTQKRIIRLSGMHASGDAAFDCSAALVPFIAEFFPLKEGADVEWSDKPRNDWRGPEDDGALIAKMHATKSGGAVFNEGGVSFTDLWDCNEAVLGQEWPSNKPNDPFDRSAADGSLSRRLAFWTGCNCERMLRLMNMSQLVRDKWTEHSTYMRDTIESACATQLNVYDSQFGKDPLIDPTPSREPNKATDPAATGWRYVPVMDQAKFFEGCVYVNDQHKVLLPNGMFVKPDAFRARFGGHTFAMDDQNLKLETNAWKVFTESQAMSFAKVDSLTFRPDLGANEVVEEEGIRSVNTYRPVDALSVDGDVSLFMQHLVKILPNDRDRTILLSYMAACVQHMGRKFQWAPLLQGVEGNGKTLFTRCVAYCIGKRYTHWPKASDLANKFNFWLLENAFIGVEDIYVPESRSEVIETLKPMITGEQLEIQGKGDNQISKEICANFLLNSNHKNAIRKTRNDRRFCVFYTAQQQASDLHRDGMNGDYFPRLYGWLKSDDGYAKVHHFLANYEIPVEFNPCLEAGGGAHRAPETSSVNEVIEASMGGIEQEILEAIDEGRVGFAGGWVSSMALDKLLQEHRAENKLPRNRRRQIMQELGYDYHPSLEGGRTTRVIPIDQGRPRLFVKVSEPLLMALEGDAVGEAYVDAQQGRGLPTGGSIFDRFPVDLQDNKAINRA